MNKTAPLHSAPLTQILQNCIIVDCETTGLNPEHNRITEIAAIRIRNAESVDRFHTLVDPETPIPQEITDLTGLTDAHVRGYPPFAHIAKDLMDFLLGTSADVPTDTALVGHNVQFDFSFLQHEFIRLQLAEDTPAGHSLPTWTPPLVDTAAAARTLIPRERVKRYRLSNVAEYLETIPKPQHRADVDVEATFEILKALAALETERKK